MRLTSEPYCLKLTCPFLLLFRAVPCRAMLCFYCQVYTQPIYSLYEDRIRSARGGEDMPVLMQFGLRIIYVLLITLVALLIPFFGSLMGLVGAVAITPTTFLLPPLMWVLYKQPAKWSVEWSVNWALVWVTGVLGVLGAIGALYSIAAAWGSFKIFAA
jgi:amino acid permease